MLASRDMANFVSQEAYERAACQSLSARDQSLALNLTVRDRTCALFADSIKSEIKRLGSSVLCVRAFYRW